MGHETRMFQENTAHQVVASIATAFGLPEAELIEQ
jgi:hypothetical protein